MRSAVETAIAAGDIDHLPWETAFHEAGHVVAEVNGGSWPDGATIVGGEDFAGRTRTRSFIGTMHPPAGCDAAFRAAIEARRDRMAVVLVAGRMAEFIALGEESAIIDDEMTAWTVYGDGDGTTDERQFRELLEGLEDVDLGWWAEERFEQAQSVLRTRWADVERLACALIERQTLSREDLWELLDPP